MPRGIQLVSGRILESRESGTRVLTLNSYVIAVTILHMEGLRVKLRDLTSVAELQVATLEAWFENIL